MKNQILIKFLITFLFFNSIFLTAREPIKGFFRCAMAQEDKQGNLKILTSHKINSQENNNDFKILFTPLKNAFLYLILSCPDNSLKLCFPNDFNDFNEEYETFSFEPPVWETLIQVGRYELYFLVTASREKNVERLLNTYKKSNNEKKLELKKELISKIREINRNKHLLINKQKVFKSDSGSIREGHETIDNLRKLSERIDFKDFYVKTIVIEK